MRKIFGFIASLFIRLGDWISDRHALVEEVNRLRIESARHLKMVSDTHAQGVEGIVTLKDKNAIEKKELLGVIEEQRLQIAHLNKLLFECRGKSDAAERGQ